MPAGSPLDDVQRWYRERCDGDWEHSNGIDIKTLDNPGWSVRIHLLGTPLEGAGFERVKIERSEEDWVQAWAEDHEWHAACGPLNLNEALGLFMAWTRSR